MIEKLAFSLSLFAAAFVATACGGGGDSDGTARIGSSGGTVASEDGRVTLDIPAGALSEDVEISVTEMSIEDAPEALQAIASGDSAYLLEPDGVTFDQPITMTLEFSGEEFPDDASAEGIELAVLATLSGDDEPEALANQEMKVDLADRSIAVTAELSHFSWVTEIRSGLRVRLEQIEPRERLLGRRFEVDAEAEIVRENVDVAIAVGEILAFRSVSFIGNPRFVAGFGFNSDGNFRTSRSLAFECSGSGPGSYTLSLRGAVNFLSADSLAGQDFTMTLDALVDCIDPDAPTVTPTSPPPPEPTFTPTPDDDRAETIVIEVTGTLVCTEPDSSFIDEVTPERATVTIDGVQWSFGWTTNGLTEHGSRWSERNTAELGSYREQVELEYGPPEQDPVLGIRLLDQRGRSVSGPGVHIYTLPDRLEQNITGTSVDGGPFQWRLEGFDQLAAFDPALLPGGLGLTAPGVIVEDGWKLQRISFGVRIFTFADAGLHECQLRLERDDVPAEFQDAFSTLGTDEPLLPRSIWRIGTRFE